VHSSSTPELTYQTINTKRGQVGMEDNGVLTEFGGIAVHDCWSPYWKYGDVTHAVCNAHLLRELTGVEQYSPEHTWAPGFKTLLRSMKRARDKAAAKGKTELSYYYLHKFDAEYDRLMKLADEECPLPPDPPQKRKGRKKKGKERSLIERLMALKASVCFFIRNFDVPFDCLIITRRNEMSATSKRRSRCPAASVQKTVRRIIWTSCLISARAESMVSAPTKH
jgi:transposase